MNHRTGQGPGEQPTNWNEGGRGTGVSMMWSETGNRGDSSRLNPVGVVVDLMVNLQQ
jgi:hypothetical protein